MLNRFQNKSFLYCISFCYRNIQSKYLANLFLEYSKTRGLNTTDLTIKIQRNAILPVVLLWV